MYTGSRDGFERDSSPFNQPSLKAAFTTDPQRFQVRSLFQ
jgi:hypothetical protein